MKIINNFYILFFKFINYRSFTKLKKTLKNFIFYGIEEKNKILTLFQTLLPEYKNQISIVVTNNGFQETLVISTWDNHIYIIVSAALIASCILVDAHPPFILRKWTLLKYAKLLRKNLAGQ